MTTDLLIVAAGMGSRLKAKGNLKPLVSLAGTPLIERAIEAAHAAGITKTTVVTGYQHRVLEEFLRALSNRRGWTIRTIFNPDFMYANGLSVLKAAPLLSSRFCLTMCDHLVEPSLYRRLLAQPLGPHEVALAVDRRLANPFVDLNDVTKVRLAGRNIRDIGKDIAPYNAFDTGVFHANASLFEAIARSLNDSGDCSISGGMKLLAAEGKAIGVDIGDSQWIDVDCPEMHELASNWLASNAL
jgi:1L-myo-inositol 1-phosphate cytidylyltransferase